MNAKTARLIRHNTAARHQTTTTNRTPAFKRACRAAKREWNSLRGLWQPRHGLPIHARHQQRLALQSEF